MALILLGLNHKSAPVKVRERLAVQSGRLPEMLARLSRAGDVSECFILSTCNRVEVLARSNGAGVGVKALEKFLVESFEIEETELGRYTYHLQDREAVGHLFRVACGLDSMVIGEPQILGQAKEAYNAAREVGTLGQLLDPLLQKTFSVAKRVRTETGIARNPVSVAYAAVEMATQIFGDLAGRTILLVGVGKMSELAARHLVGQGVTRVQVASRNFGHAVSMAEKFGGLPVDFANFHDKLVEVDIVLTSTAAPHTIIRREHVESAMTARRGRPLFLIDIAVPRDIDPAVNDLENVYLYNIDDLQAVVEANRESRRQEAVAAERIVEQECDSFVRRLRRNEAGPLIAALVERMTRVGQEELIRMRGKLGDLTPRQEKQIEALAHGLVHKILHRPIQELKRSTEDGGDPQVLDLAKRLFDLEDSGPAAPAEDERVSVGAGPAKGPTNGVGVGGPRPAGTGDPIPAGRDEVVPQAGGDGAEDTTGLNGAGGAAGRGDTGKEGSR